MENLPTLWKQSPIDILFKNFFQDDDFFHSFPTKISHPVDIYETDEGIVFEIACTGIPKEEIEITTQDGILRVLYSKAEKGERFEYAYKGIAKRSFNLDWRVPARFDLSRGAATFTNGLLTIKIPSAKEKESKLNVIEIQ
jgi:HSP20 family molecular chaperone IbpA